MRGIMDAGDRSPTLIQSVQRALRILEAVGAHEERAQAKELARAVGLSLSTTYHLLRTLTHEGYLRHLDDGSYVIGPAFGQVASQNRMASVLARCRPAMQTLRDELRSPVYLALYHEGEIAVVEIVDSPKIPSIDLWIGIHDSAHATALGKCILGTLDEERRRDYLARHPLHQLTRHTVTDRRVLESVIHQSTYFARDDQEYAVGVHCLATPVATPEFIGAVAVARHTSRPTLNVDNEVVRTLTRGAGRIARSLGIPDSI
jgi:IclR family acetate operon transcriptional repressor